MERIADRFRFARVEIARRLGQRRLLVDQESGIDASGPPRYVYLCRMRPKAERRIVEYRVAGVGRLQVITEALVGGDRVGGQWFCRNCLPGVSGVCRSWLKCGARLPR